jgi:hypothetical protein
MRRERVAETDRPRVIDARGGVSFGAILTGVVVTFGAVFLLSAIVFGVLTAVGLQADELTDGDEASLGVGIALVAVTFLSYLWGGYTAGRMGRGAGVINGLLVVIVAALLVGAIAAIAGALEAETNFNLPFNTSRLPLTEEGVEPIDYGVPIGIASLVAMVVGAILGGGMGARWHTKLERDALEREEETVREERTRESTDRQRAEAEKRAEAEHRAAAESAADKRAQEHPSSAPSRPTETPSTTSREGAPPPPPRER